MNKRVSYSLLDSGDGKKLEAFGPVTLSRPCAVALWKKSKKKQFWNESHGDFSRKDSSGWSLTSSFPRSWKVDIENITFKLSLTDFGHVGIFPEQMVVWRWLRKYLSGQKKSSECRVLNLFAYTGGSSLACALEGASVCHVDASPATVNWAKENATLNGIEKGIRWIVDDVFKFVEREIRRGKKYEAIILDPPTFGRGPQGQLFKFEEDLVRLLERCKELLSPQAHFLALSCHTPGITGICLEHLVRQSVGNRQGSVTQGDMLLEGEGLPLPNGTFAIWHQESKGE
jgi:23S rRNA (cytosine1962-C5)-methyltransferase